MERRAGVTRKFNPQARPEERGSGESRGNRHWHTGGHNSRGNLAGTPAGPQDSESGETRGTNRRRYRTTGVRGNSQSGSRHRRKMKCRGNQVLHHGKAGGAGQRETGDRRQRQSGSRQTGKPDPCEPRRGSFAIPGQPGKRGNPKREAGIVKGPTERGNLRCGRLKRQEGAQ